MWPLRLEFPWDKPEQHLKLWNPELGVWWRVEQKSYSGCQLDVNGFETYYSTHHLQASWFPVIRETPKGVWLARGPTGFWPSRKPVRGIDMLVLRDSRRAYARATLQEALESFVARKRRQIKILSSQLAGAENAMGGAEKYLNQHFKKGQTDADATSLDGLPLGPS